MKYLDFPEGYVLSQVEGVYALPHNCWAVSLRNKSVSFMDVHSGKHRACILIWPDGEVGFLHGQFARSPNHDYIVYLGEIKGSEETALAYKGLTFRNQPTHKVLKFGNKFTGANQCRHKHMAQGIAGFDPVCTGERCYATPMPKNYPVDELDFQTDLEIVVRGLLGTNLGIGGYRFQERGRRSGFH